jgi:hypothetical protein
MASFVRIFVTWKGFLSNVGESLGVKLLRTDPGGAWAINKRDEGWRGDSFGGR